ncbi:hypothetical protein M9H77_08401 [Catharanthus roseus]|uniref:Uncharacterized protein n=1 Tax=Catharanthus roseus TaxID=4058 RepID=A0ACC0BXW2_CATRO|nr:hypothetical protein M9H77_08401 [Catharanthus roseus]
MVDELPRIKELLQAKIKKNLETNVEKEISNEDSYDVMNEKSIEKEECNEFKEKERVGGTKSLSENSCYIYSISTLCEKFKKDECSKDKEYELLKSGSTKENENFLECTCTWTSKLGRNHTMKSEDKGEIDYVLSCTIQRVLRKKGSPRGRFGRAYKTSKIYYDHKKPNRSKLEAPGHQNNERSDDGMKNRAYR